MNLYGNDMSETISPLQANMGWTIAWEPENRQFIGRDALEAERAAGVATRLVGLVLDGRGVMRSHQKVIVDLGNGEQGEGEVTSGTFSPTLECSIAMARVPVATGDSAMVEIRGKQLPVRVVKLPFVRNGKKVYE
jgi:aminomethyltransferase